MAALAERIEAAFDDAVRAREAMFNARATTEAREANAKLDHADDWASAKNNDVRAVMLASWLHDDDVYQRVRAEYEEVRDTYRLSLLEIERLRLLVALEGGS